MQSPYETASEKDKQVNDTKTMGFGNYDLTVQTEQALFSIKNGKDVKAHRKVFK